MIAGTGTGWCQSPAIPHNARSDKAIDDQLPTLQDAFKKKGLVPGNKVFIRVFKKTDDFEIWVKKGNTFQLFANYKICDYSGGLGSKKKQGDSKTPEGFYFVKPSSMFPSSTFHLAFNIGYPNKYDRSHGHSGGAIMVHGDCVSIGCIAMTDLVIEKIWTIITKAFEKGQPFFRIHIFPFRMTDENLENYMNSPNLDFWNNLREGYDFFEKNGYPPNVEVADGKYIFE
nr:murein L,D-transpeptidase [Bacteroidota bacterium]